MAKNSYYHVILTNNVEDIKTCFKLVSLKTNDQVFEVHGKNMCSSNWHFQNKSTKTEKTNVVAV